MAPLAQFQTRPITHAISSQSHPAEQVNDGGRKNATTNPFISLSQFTLVNSSAPMNGLNILLSNMTNIATVLHGGYKIKGLLRASRSNGPSWYEPHKFPGLLPGIYNPKQATRRHILDLGLAMGCTWNCFDAFAHYSAENESFGMGFAAGAAESVNQFIFNFFYAESIIFKAMDTTMKLIGKLFPKSYINQINQELTEAAPKVLVQNGIPMSYRLTRSLVGGAVGLLTLNFLLESFNRLITPLAAQHLGPVVDRLFPGKKID